jgi:hypothetical protein
MASTGFRASLLGINASDPSPAGTPPCSSNEAAWRDLLHAEWSLGPAASAAPTVEWYPTLADIAPSADLGFTLGSLTGSASSGPRHGQFLSVWRRDSACRWQLVVDAGITYGGEAPPAPRLSPDQTTYRAAIAPPALLVNEDALGQAVSGFQTTCQQDGVAAGLRTYARNGDFLFLMDDAMPMGLKNADLSLTDSGLTGIWREIDKGRSTDAALAYSIGTLFDDRRGFAHTGVQIWQFDPTVANWGLRILLIGSGSAVSN